MIDNITEEDINRNRADLLNQCITFIKLYDDSNTVYSYDNLRRIKIIKEMLNPIYEYITLVS